MYTEKSAKQPVTLNPPTADREGPISNLLAEESKKLGGRLESLPSPNSLQIN
jgi:hypothetical protein